MHRYSTNHPFRVAPQAPINAKAQEGPVWQGAVGLAGLDIDYDDAWDLWCAAIDGHLPTIEYVIEKDARIANVVYRYHMPLDMAIYGGHLETARRLIDAGAELCFKYGSHHWERMTRIARARGHHEVAELLIETVTKRFNYNPDIHLFFEAFRAQDTQQVKRLLDEKPDRLHLADMNGDTLLHWAVIAWQVPMIDVLVEYGADMNRENGAALVPHRLNGVSTYACNDEGMHEGLKWSEHWPAAIRRLVELGPNEDDIIGDIRRNDFDAVRARVEHSPECLHNFRGKQIAPLSEAVDVGNIDMVRLLLDLGANPKLPEVTGPFGEALYTACCRGCPDTVRLLLEHGADPMSYSDSSGDCYMAAACWGDNHEEKVSALNDFSGCEFTVLEYRNEEKPTLEQVQTRVREALSQEVVSDWMVKHLLARITYKGNSVELLNEYVDRLDDRAIAEIKQFVVPDYFDVALKKRLIELGATPRRPLSPADVRQSPLGECGVHSESNEQLVEEFVAAGGDIDAVDHYSMVSPLSRACADGKYDLVKRILALGARLDNPPQDGCRPIDRAKANGHDEIVKLLESETR